MVGLMTLYSCDKDEEDIVEPVQNTNNNNGNNGGNNGGNNSTDTPSQELQNMSANSIIMEDSATGAKTTYNFNYYAVRAENSGKSAHVYVRENQGAFPPGDQFTLNLTEGENNPVLSSGNKTYAYRTPPIATYPETDEWQFRLCPSGGIPDKNYDCYTQEQGPGPFYEILSETKMFYERNGETHTFMFENHKRDDKTFMGKIVITNSEIGKASWDGTEQTGSL